MPYPSMVLEYLQYYLSWGILFYKTALLLLEDWGDFQYMNALFVDCFCIGSILKCPILFKAWKTPQYLNGLFFWFRGTADTGITYFKFL